MPLGGDALGDVGAALDEDAELDTINAVHGAGTTTATISPPNPQALRPPGSVRTQSASEPER